MTHEPSTKDAALPSLPSFCTLVHLSEIGSTNDEAKARAEAGAPAGTLIWADRQTGGRGRRGRAWHSPPGNLYCSLVLRPTCSAAVAAQLSFVTALGLGEGLSACSPSRAVLRYKWPNDVLLSGRKVAGILLESQPDSRGALDWLVIGVGVNVRTDPPAAAVDFPATSLHAEGFSDVEPAAVLAAFATSFALWFDRWQQHGFAPVREAWLAAAAGLGQSIEVRLPHETLAGRFADLDGDGALVLDSDGRSQSIAAGAVYFPTPSEA